MPRDFVLLATLGRTDVQVVLSVDGEKHRFSVAPGSTRPFQEACYASKFPWNMLPLDAVPEIPEKRNLFLDFDTQSNRLTYRLTAYDDTLRDYDCTAGVTLCAPLLSATVSLIKHRQQSKALGNCIRVLLFNTRRQPPVPDEPSYAAPLVTKALAQALDIEEHKIQECIFLSHGDLYEAEASGDRHLRNEAARRIDESLKNTVHQLRDEGRTNLVAVISDVGGLPETKAVLAESARYRFGEVRFLRPVEARSDAVIAQTPEYRIPPAESLQTRRQVSSLIRAGAWEAAARLANDCVTEKQASSEPWRAWLRAVVGALGGQTPDLASIDGRTHDAFQAVLESGPVLLVAFRIESALRRKAWVDALRELFTWYDLCLVSLANKYLSAESGKPCIDVATSTLTFNAATKTVQEVLRRTLSKPKKYFYLDSEVQNLLRTLLPDNPKTALINFEDAISQVRRYRNAATHGWLSAAEVEQACRTLWGIEEPVLLGGIGRKDTQPELPRQSAVWQKQRPHFLASPCAIALFEQVGIPNPNQLYENLVNAVLSDMDEFSFLESPQSA